MDLNNTGMSWRKRTAALIATAALGGVVAFGGVVAPAWAAEDATVTITPAEGNQAAGYTGYRLFTAEIETGADKVDKAFDVEWDSAVDVDVVVSRLKEFGYNEDAVLSEDAEKLAQNAFEFVNARIGSSESAGNIGGNKVVASESFAMKFAQWVQTNKIGTEVQSVSGNDGSYTLTGSEGYYLVMSDAIAGESSIATAPIWFALGGQTTTIEEKASVPTVDKTITGDTPGTNGGSAQIGDVLDFKIEATLPGNYGSYDKFKVVLKDTPTNLSIVRDSAVIKSGDNVLTPDNANVTVEYGTNGESLTVTIADLKTVDKTATKDTVVTVTYKAELTKDAVTTPEGNKNKVEYDYSNKPGADTTGKVEDDPVPVYTYQLDLTKKDKGTETALSGAEFIIKNDATGKYFNKETGKWDVDNAEVAKAAPLVTDDQGVIAVKGLAEGTYTLTEVKAPKGYETPSGAAADIKLTVSPTIDSATGEQTGLSFEASGSLVIEKPSSDQATGHLSITAVNDKNIALAMTGAEGVGLAGAGVLGIGLAWYLVRNHRKNGEQA